MAALVLFVLFLAMAGGSSANWCVCRTGMSDSALQKALDYACGAGADCTPLLQNGPCYQPNTVKDHCSYAANSYYQKKAQAPGTCDFAGTAQIVTQDPSTGSCAYPASASSGGTGSTPTTNAPSSTNPSITPPTSSSGTPTPPTIGTPFGGTGGTGGVGGIGGVGSGGFGSGISPSGTGINTDTTGAGSAFKNTNSLSSVLTMLWFCGLLLLWD